MSEQLKKDSSTFEAKAAKWFPILLVGIFALYGLSKMRPQKSESDFDYATFGSLPVQAKGRVKPLDTVARNALLIMRGKQTVPNGPEVSFYEKWFEGKRALDTFPRSSGSLK